jgi:hypothetical protein
MSYSICGGQPEKENYFVVTYCSEDRHMCFFLLEKVKGKDDEKKVDDDTNAEQTRSQAAKMRVKQGA